MDLIKLVDALQPKTTHITVSYSEPYQPKVTIYDGSVIDFDNEGPEEYFYSHVYKITVKKTKVCIEVF